MWPCLVGRPWQRWCLVAGGVTEAQFLRWTSGSSGAGEGDRGTNVVKGWCRGRGVGVLLERWCAGVVHHALVFHAPRRRPPPLPLRGPRRGGPRPPALRKHPAPALSQFSEIFRDGSFSIHFASYRFSEKNIDLQRFYFGVQFCILAHLVLGVLAHVVIFNSENL